MKHAQETTEIRRALTAAGYPAKVGHGRGTAYNWIHATVSGIWTETDWDDHHNGIAYGIIKKVSGREHLHDDIQSDYFCENIQLRYDAHLPSAEQYAAMTREELAQRAEDLQDHLGRLEYYNVTSGDRFWRIKVDLAASRMMLNGGPR